MDLGSPCTRGYSSEAVAHAVGSYKHRLLGLSRQEEGQLESLAIIQKVHL